MVANVMFDPVLNKTYYDYGKDDNSSIWYGQNEKTMPIWILNEIKNNSRKSAIIGHFPGADVPFLNRTVTYSQDYDNSLDWFKKVDCLIDLFTNKNKTDRINFGVLYYPDPDETGHTYGPYSINVKTVLEKLDSVVEYLIEKLVKNDLYDTMNIIITSDHGMDEASLENSINLSDYIDINKFKSYGGLTQINIFPNDRKIDFLFFLTKSFIKNLFSCISKK